MRQLTALQNVTLTLEGVEYSDVSEEIDSLVNRLVRKYTMEVLMQVRAELLESGLARRPLATA